MSDIERLITKHYSLNVIDDVKTICAPLKKIGIKHFCYGRNYKDGTTFVLTVTPEMIERAHQVFIAGLSEEGSYIQDGFDFQCDLAGEMGLEDYFLNFEAMFDVSHHLVFNENHENCLEQFWFGVSPKQPEIYSFYMSNIDLFERFILYFKDKADHLIVDCEKNRLKIPRTPKPRSKTDEFDALRQDFLNEIKHNRYFLDCRKSGAFISKRELDVVLCLSRGHTFKEIGSELLLSPRTVESYLANVKNKLGCFNKSQVLDVYLKSNLAKKNLDI